MILPFCELEDLVFQNIKQEQDAEIGVTDDNLGELKRQAIFSIVLENM